MATPERKASSSFDPDPKDAGVRAPAYSPKTAPDEASVSMEVVAGMIEPPIINGWRDSRRGSQTKASDTFIGLCLRNVSRLCPATGLGGK